jgi:hypothetical protein
MRFCVMTFGVVLLLAVRLTSAADLCGEAPSLSDPALARGVTQAAQVFKVSAAARQTFANLAATFYRSLAEGRSSGEVRSIAVALLQASCLQLTQGEDPGKLPGHVKDKLVGLSTLVPDFNEAHALLERIKAAEAGR